MTFQRTLKSSVTFSGLGLFLGQKSRVMLHPQEVDHGLFFKKDGVLIEAKVENVKRTFRSTTLGKDGVLVGMVEHLLAALSAFGISNLLIEIEGDEIPILDGSAKELVSLIEKAGILEQNKEQEKLIIGSPFYYSQEGVQIIALPFKGCRLSYLLRYPKLSFGTQFLTIDLNEKTFKREIAPARTFSVLEEIQVFLDQGLIKGGGLESAVVIKEGRLLNPEGFRFPDELVRHKLLDLVGDLSLSGKVFEGQILALYSGHSANVAFVRGLLQNIMRTNHAFTFNNG